MSKLILLTDGSVNTQSKIGYGAYLALSEFELSLPELRTRVQIKRFEQTSSTKLELQTLLWALSDVQAQERQVTIYTDSQNIISLPGRRNRLEQNHFLSAKNTLLNNYELYQQFYRWIDQLDCQLIKVQGHLPLNQKASIDQLFNLVDKASRKALREDII